MFGKIRKKNTNFFWEHLRVEVEIECKINEFNTFMTEGDII